MRARSRACGSYSWLLLLRLACGWRAAGPAHHSLGEDQPPAKATSICRQVGSSLLLRGWLRRCARRAVGREAPGHAKVRSVGCDREAAVRTDRALDPCRPPVVDLELVPEPGGMKQH